MTIESLCFDYFKSVNPIAQKIGEDIEKIAQTNKSEWDSLPDKAKNKLIDGCLIDEKLVEKYDALVSQEVGEVHPSELFSFSWFTRSQLNLFTLIDLRPERSVKSPMRKTEVLSPGRGKARPAPPQQPTVPTPAPTTAPGEKTCPRKPKTPPPPPPAKLSIPAASAPAPGQTRVVTTQPSPDDIPKTGFDFLDNW